MGPLLLCALAVGLSPTAILAVVLLLITPRARANGGTFLLGWIVGIALVGVLVLALVGPVAVGERGQPAAWLSWLKLAAGCLLLVIAALQWRVRPAPDAEVALPRWTRTLDGITPGKASGLALLLGAFNPKSLLFIVAGATVVAQRGSAAGTEAIAWIIFTVVATLGVGLPVLIYVVQGEQAVANLTRLKGWLVRNTSAIFAGLCAIIGVTLIVDAVSSWVGG